MKFGLGIEKSESVENSLHGIYKSGDIKGDAVHPENDYNDSEEGFLGEVKMNDKRETLTPIEEMVDEASDPEEFINRLSDKLEAEIPPSEDKYDFLPILDGLAKTAKNNGAKELDDFITKANQFFTQYKEILKSGLSDERNEARQSEGREYEAVRRAFKNIFGEVIYSDGKMEAYKSGFISIKKPPVNEKGFVELGNKIYYDKRGIGYLSEAEAKKSSSNSDKRRNNYKKVASKV